MASSFPNSTDDLAERAINADTYFCKSSSAGLPSRFGRPRSSIEVLPWPLPGMDHACKLPVYVCMVRYIAVCMYSV